jgi:hypothetical protein
MSEHPSKTFQSAGLDMMVIDQQVVGSRRLSNILLGLVVSIGGIGFIIASLSSRLGRDILPILHASQLNWIPQGIVMGLYGLVAILLAFYLWIIIAIDLGGGFNLFDKNTGVATISRRGLRRPIQFECSLSDIQAVKVEVRDGLSAIRRISLRIRGRRDIPISRVGEPIPLADLERSGASLARFLGVPLEGI